MENGVGKLKINENCKNCGLCLESCPIHAIEKQDHKMMINDHCVQCNVCYRVCPFHAIDPEEKQKKTDVCICKSCPIQCTIPLGATGACKRYTNVKGRLIRNRSLVITNKKVKDNSQDELAPITTAVGAGTNYPCIRPAPYIVSECRNNVDVVTVVTEAPLSYSGLTIKIDTNMHIGSEGDRVYRNGRVVGMVNTEEYGSKMLAIGGASRLTGKNGFCVANTIVELANGRPVELTIERKTTLKLQMGQAPVINGVKEKKMRVGCGSATIGLFARQMKEAVDECIVLDHHVIGLFSEHLAGEEVGMSWSGVVVNAKKSSRGRYFGEKGDGIGGTSFAAPRDVIKSIDMSVAKTNMRILVVNTTGEIYALYTVNEVGELIETEMSPEALALVQLIHENCEEARTSIMYVGGAGGSARGGVCKRPLELTKAVHEGKSKLTVGGAPAYILPGGGINFIVDAEKMVKEPLCWVPTPATVAPLEFTMKKEDYIAIGGHGEDIQDIHSIKNEAAYDE